MKIFKVLTLLAVAIAAGYAGGHFTSSNPNVQKQESVYQRVLRTQTIRCGYNYYAPVLTRNEKTGKLEGVYVDYMEALGKLTGLKIEWTSEIGWGDVPIALKDKKIDAFCAGTWADARRGTQIAFTAPVFFNVIQAYGRADDHRFETLNAINNPQIIIAAIDGSVPADIAAQEFPNAKTLSLPVLDSDADELLNVASGKADVAFTSGGPAALYMQNNPGKLQLIASGKPIRVFGVTTAVTIDDPPLLEMLNTATQQLVDSGTVDRILAKYEKDYPSAFVKVAPRYDVHGSE